MFSKKQLEGQKLPRTQAERNQVFLRAHYQSAVWRQANIPKPTLPSQSECGWIAEEDQYTPCPTTLLLQHRMQLYTLLNVDAKHQNAQTNHVAVRHVILYALNCVLVRGMKMTVTIHIQN
jgi:hypothetical protein